MGGGRPGYPRGGGPVKRRPAGRSGGGRAACPPARRSRLRAAAPPPLPPSACCSSSPTATSAIGKASLRQRALARVSDRRATCGRTYLPTWSGVLSAHSANAQIPPDFVVECQAADIVEVISSLIWRRNIVQTSCRNRKGRCEPFAPLEAHWSTTKSGGIVHGVYRRHPIA
jgi:hypothetical protein